MLGDGLLGLVEQLLSRVLGFDEVARALVFVSVRLGVLDHLLDFGLVEPRATFDANLLHLARALVGCGDVEDAVGIDVERHLDLRHAAGCSRDADELELAERLVVASDLALTLEHVDLDGRLPVFGSRKDLGLAGRDRRVALDQLGHHATLGLDTEREWCDVEQEDVLDVAAQHAGLDGGADCDDLIRVDTAMRILVGDLFDLVLDRGHATHAADEDHVIDIGRCQTRIGESLLGRSDGALNEIANELGQLRARERHVEVLRTRGVSRDEGQVDLRRLRRRQLDLGLLGGLIEALQGKAVGREVDTLILLKLGDHPVDDCLVEVVATEVVVACGCLDFEDAVGELEDGHVEGAAAEVEDEHFLLALLVDAVGECSSRRLVDDAQDVEARNAARILRGLALSIVEVGRHRNHGIRHLLAELGLSIGLQLLEDHRRDFLGRELAVVGRDLGVAIGARDHRVGDHRHLFRHLGRLASHEALDREDRVFWIGNSLPLGGAADEALAILGKRDDRRRSAAAFSILNDRRLAAFKNGHTRVGSTEIDSDYATHKGYASVEMG